MRKIFIILIFSFILGSCVNTQHGSKNEILNSSFYPLIITKVDVKLVDTKYKITGRTTAIPPSLIKKLDKYVYRIEFDISVKDEIIWDQPFLLNVQFSDGTSKNFLFNDEKYILANTTIYNYEFSIEVETKQKLNICLGYVDENGNEIFDSDNPFKCKTIEIK